MRDKRILVVDDEPDICALLLEILEDSGALLFAANDAVTALEIWEKEKVDLVISDIRMPVHDGLYLLREILKRKSDAKVWMMSGYTDYRLDDLLREGALGLISKPFRPAEFLDVVNKALK